MSGYTVVGLDCFTPYYEPSSKRRNLAELTNVDLADGELRVLQPLPGRGGSHDVAPIEYTIGDRLVLTDRADFDLEVVARQAQPTLDARRCIAPGASAAVEHL